MLFEKLSEDKINFAHLFALKKHPYEFIINDDKVFIVHSLFSNIYSVEVSSKSSINLAINVLDEKKPDLLLTTNQIIFNHLSTNYINSYRCLQFVFPTSYSPDPNLQILKYNDLEYVKQTYHNSEYVQALFNHNRLLGYYSNKTIIGYSALHIDGTIGAVYVDPVYRRHSYGSAILKATVNYFYNGALYSHVKSDNTASIKLHHSIDALESKPHIYWMHNKGFSYN